MGLLKLFSVFLICIFSFAANCTEVNFGGYAFAGNAADELTNYKYSSKLLSSPESKLKLNAQLREKISKVNNPDLEIKLGELANLESGTGTIVLGFVIDRETVSTEEIDNTYKLVVNLSGQALFFDFKELVVLATYPVTIEYIDVSPTAFDNETKAAIVEKLYFGGLENNINIIDDLVNVLSKIKFEQGTKARIGITNVSVDQESLEVMPKRLRENEVIKTVIAQEFNKFLSSNQSIPVLPYGQSINGKLAVNFADGSIFNLKIPEPDFGIELHLKPFKKIKFSETAAGASWIYGSYLEITIIEPLSQKKYFNATIKNGATKIIPSSQTKVADWPAYQESLLLLINNFTSAISNAPDKSWAKRYAGDKAIAEQMKKLKEVIKKCTI